MVPNHNRSHQRYATPAYINFFHVIYLLAIFIVSRLSFRQPPDIWVILMLVIIGEGIYVAFSHYQEAHRSYQQLTRDVQIQQQTQQFLNTTDNLQDLLTANLSSAQAYIPVSDSAAVLLRHVIEGEFNYYHLTSNGPVTLPSKNNQALQSFLDGWFCENQPRNFDDFQAFVAACPQNALCLCIVRSMLMRMITAPYSLV